jgi:hypothetical protein
MDALSFACWGGKREREREREKEREKLQGGFFPRVEHALLAVLHGTFAAVRCK